MILRWRAINDRELWTAAYLIGAELEVQKINSMGVAVAPPSWTNYFKIMQFVTRNWVYTHNHGLLIRFFLRVASPSVKKAYLNFARPAVDGTDEHGKVSTAGIFFMLAAWAMDSRWVTMLSDWS